MQNRKFLLMIVMWLTGGVTLAQDPAVIKQYINSYKDFAIEEMQRTGVPAAIKLAQGIHETMAGTSDLVKKSNNHFGIKCKETWNGPSVKHDDDLQNECFRKYNSAEESYKDHSDFLKTRPRYAFLFNLDPTDYKGWAYGLKKAGYATNPKYPQVIIKLIEDYQLEDYTLIAMGKMKPKKEEVLAKANPEIIQQPVQKTTVNSRSVEPAFINQPGSELQKTDIKLTEPKTQPEIAAKKPQYPTGEFKINETRVVFAKQGAPFLAIAQQYNIPLAWLFDFNDMKEAETLQQDQLLYLQRKRKTGLNEIHIVKPGENLYDIAQQEAIRLESLMEYNMLGSNMQPAVGEQLYLKTKAPSKPRLAIKENRTIYSLPENISGNHQTVKREAETIIYTVRHKETIWAIAQKYNVKMNDIVAWNQLQGHDLKAGQLLKIYK